MEQPGKIWHTAREYVGHWFWTGVFVACTGATPDHVFAEVIKPLGLMDRVHTLWPAEMDPHMALPAAGAAIMVVDVVRRAIGRRNSHSGNEGISPASISISAPVSVQTPVTVNAPVTVNFDANFARSVVTTVPMNSAAVGERNATKPINLPYQPLGAGFIGRETFLRDLHTSLSRDNGGTAPIVSNVIHGMGGIGKSRTAVEYAWAYRDDYTALLFVEADRPEILELNVAALAGPLRLPQAAVVDVSVRLQAVLAWLGANPTWLLVFDNVDTDAARDAVMRTLGPMTGGHVLLTSRLDAGGWYRVTPMALDVLGVSDAADFLLEATAGQRAPAPDERAQAEAMGRELGQLPLALDLAAATIRRRHCTFDAYMVLWNGTREEVTGWHEAPPGYHSAVGKTWALSVNQLKDHRTKILLHRLAFLAPEPVPDSLLDVPVPHGPGVDARKAMIDLVAYSLVKRDTDKSPFTVHRLIQDATSRGMAPAEAEERLTEALWWMNAAFEGHPEDPRLWPRLAPLVVHIEAVTEAAEQARIADPTVRVLHDLGTLSRVTARYARAEPPLRRALALAEAHRGAPHPWLAPVLGNLAQLLQDTNRLAEAEPLMRRALAIDEASLGADHPNVAAHLNNLATLLGATDRLAEAEPLMRRQLLIFLTFERANGHAHPHRDAAIANYTILLAEMGHDEASIRSAIDTARREAGLG